MRLYNSTPAPNARRVRIFLAEKGIDVPRVSVDLGKIEHKTPDFTGVNPLFGAKENRFVDMTGKIPLIIHTMCSEVMGLLTVMKRFRCS